MADTPIVEATQPVVLLGSGGSPGIVSGPAFVYAPRAHTVGGPPGDVPAALALLARTQRDVAVRLGQRAAALREQRQAREAAIFEAHGALVHDAALTSRVERYLAGGVSLPQAIDAAVAEMTALLEGLGDEHLRERAADVRAIGEMLRAALSGGPRWVDAVPAGAIVIAHDLTPADTFDLRAAGAAGFATAYGGPNGHTAILARSLGLPAVVGAGPALLSLANETPLLLDGATRTVVISPSRAMLEDAERQAALLRARELAPHEAKPARLRDGHEVALRANIVRPEEADAARAAGAMGVGLFRSEFLFFDRPAPPGEEEQRAAYSAVLRACAPHPVVIRTLDVGGDKPLPYLPALDEPNPALGARGLRLCMRHPALFRTQLRALLRAALDGDLWVMLPMVSSPEDVAWGRAELRAAADALEAEGVPHRADVRLGITIETPAAAAIADLLAREASFFSIGSNDLAQYALAADRSDGLLAARYPAASPAVMRLIAQAAQAARAAGIPVALCGELACDPAVAPALVGLGVGELSMSAGLIEPIRARLEELTLAEAETIGRRLSQTSGR
jgi:phosphoenolpyruvate-protein phosphotransferase